MIAKGNLHAHGGRLAAYMMKGKGDERAELIEARGFLSTDLREAFCTIQAIAESQTQCEKPFFHVYVRLPDDEALDKETWLAVADRVEAAVGFQGQPRAVAFHVAPDGERHIHVAWSRIDTDAMRAIDPGLYKNRLTDLSRELEVEYGLRRLQSQRSPEQQTKAPARSEFEEARRLGVDVDATREAIRACYDRSDNGPSFVSALAEHGLSLARGDRRDFVVIDQEGGQHALGKRICGVPLGEIRQRFGEEFKRNLPSVHEVRRADRIARDANASITAEPSPVSLGRGAADIRLAWTLTDSGAGFAAALEDRGFVLAKVTRDEAEGSHRRASFAHAVGNFAPRYSEGELVAVNGFGGVYKLTERVTGDNKGEIAKYLATIDHTSLLSVADARGVAREASRETYRDELLRSAKPTKVEKLIGDAVRTAGNGEAFNAVLASEGIFLARATKEDIAYLHQAFSDERIAALGASDPNVRGPSETMLRIKEGELVAVNRYGGLHRLNPYQVDTERAAALVAEGVNPRFGGVDSIQAVRGDILQGRDDAAAMWADIRAETQARRGERLPAASTHSDVDIAIPTTLGVRVTDTLARGASGVFSAAAQVVEGAVGFLDGLFGGAGADHNKAKAMEPPLPSPEPPREANRNERHAAVARAAEAALQARRVHASPTAESELDLTIENNPGRYHQRARERERERDRDR